MGQAKAEGTCLTLNDFALLMRHEECDLKIGTLPKNLSCFSTKIS